MLSGNVKMAIESVTAVKWRSFLTTIGVIIGIVSVVITVSLGEGLKHQIVGQISHLGDDLITIRPGKIVDRDGEGRIVKVHALAGSNFKNGSLPAKDLEVIQSTNGVKQIVPISLISSGIKVDNNNFDGINIIGTSADLPDILRQKINYGGFFDSQESQLPVAVIGSNLAYKLFQEQAPVGMSLEIHGQNFVVRGVFDDFKSSPIAFGPDFNNAIFVPYQVASQLTGGNNQLAEVLARSSSAATVNSTINKLNSNMLNSHGGQQDFTILRQDENLTVTNEILNTLTGFIAAIASISLLVGGIGIMNIMLVSVTERTREIGIRKAIGATNRQIMEQFLVEALVLSLGGAIVGFIISLVAIGCIRLLTHFQPIITWPVVAIAIILSVAIGVLFGLMPAVKAARKDPIDALRYE